LESFLIEKTLPNIILAGKQGIGKTLISKLLITELGADHLFINCGYEGTIDVIRSKVVDFCNAMRLNTDVPKIVVLDEADSLSRETAGSSAQKALRNIIQESSDDTRFILTCNYLGNIIEPLQSRCVPIGRTRRTLTIRLRS